jgi:hypothetical protein
LVFVTVHVEPETLTVNDDPGVDELPQKQVGVPPGGAITQQVSRAGGDGFEQEPTAPEMSDNPRSVASARRMAWRNHWRAQPVIVKRLVFDTAAGPGPRSAGRLRSGAQGRLIPLAVELLGWPLPCVTGCMCVSSGLWPRYSRSPPVL